MIKRTIKPLKNRSFFLFGPRQTGKSTYVNSILGHEDLYINLLPQRAYLAYTRQPELFRQEVLAHHKKIPDGKVIVNEIQKIPILLDEIHDLIEALNIEFVLTGSSARKLKRGAANLLAGRANTYSLFPLTFEELGEEFDLERALLIGCLPYLWAHQINAQAQQEFLRAYTDTYLREEIQAEGVVRNIGPFERFLDVAANNDGKIVNFSSIARECGVSVKTAQEYYQILEDSFIAHRIEPWTKSVRKRLVSHPRYYFFDTGVTNALCNNFGTINAETRGRRFEQFLIMQLIALISYYRLGYKVCFWRTNNGLEIDVILVKNNSPQIAIEIKSTTTVTSSDARTLREFKTEYPHVETFIVNTGERARMLDGGVEVIPWQVLCNELKARALTP